MDALLAAEHVEAVVALGSLADSAWQAWKATETGGEYQGAYAHVTHPTQPESSAGGDREELKRAIRDLLQNWNTGLEALKSALRQPDQERELVPYGESFAPGDLVAIPAADLPAGSPAWMRSPEQWAARTGSTPQATRFTIAIRVPASFQRT